MSRPILQLALLGVIAMLLSGCNIGPWGGPAYTFDPRKLWTGEQSIVPRNDSAFSNGEQMDYRTRR